MRIADLISVFSIVGTFLAAIATFLTVREIIKQRKASYRPELVLSRIIFFASIDPRIAGNLPLLWAHKLKGDENLERIEISINNIGLGAAKAVTISWAFPVEELLKVLQNLADKTGSNGLFSFNDGTIQVKSDRIGSCASMWKNQQIRTIDYVLPASAQGEPITLEIPHAYVLLVSALYNLASQNDKENWPFVPPLRAALEYSDIADERRTAVYDIQINLIALFGTGEAFHAYLEPKRAREH